MVEYEPNHDKSTWGEGEWQHEPDRVDFFDPETGYQCLILRGPMGSLNGYVGVPYGHPAYGVSYMNDVLVHINVHGGLTYSNGPGENSTAEIRTYWHGFDCSHYQDLSPKMRVLYAQVGLHFESRPEPDVYRNLAYVRAEVARLAKQLKDMETCALSSLSSPSSEG